LEIGVADGRYVDRTVVLPSAQIFIAAGISPKASPDGKPKIYGEFAAASGFLKGLANVKLLPPDAAKAHAEFAYISIRPVVGFLPTDLKSFTSKFTFLQSIFTQTKPLSPCLAPKTIDAKATPSPCRTADWPCSEYYPALPRSLKLIQSFLSVTSTHLL
jgi:hypothetical protein